MNKQGLKLTIEGIIKKVNKLTELTKELDKSVARHTYKTKPKQKKEK